MANPEHLAILKEGMSVWGKWRKENSNIRPDLSKANLSWGNLSGADLSGADLSWADLSGADLRRANLSGGNLSGADLSRGNLSEADLSRGNLKGADLRRTNLSGGNLSEAQLNRANLSRANLSGGNLSVADLSGADLRRTNLSGGNLSGAQLNRANLSEANLSEANLSGADLSEANLSEANLSGTVIDRYTVERSSNIIGIELGVNGIYNLATDSSALIQMTPPGNSMQGSNADAIVESLKHARKLHNISLGFAGISLLIAVLKPKNIRLPLFPDFSSEPSHYAVLAILCSVGILMLTESFMRSALDGVQYINDRDSAMKVGHFPWTMSKYDKGQWGRWQSLIMRIFLCFHPLAYPILYFTILPDRYMTIFSQIEIFPDPYQALFFFMIFPDVSWVLFPRYETWLFYFGNILVCITYLGLLVLCGRIFWLSQQFQKPILFDPATERARKTDAAVLNERVSELIELLKSKKS